MKVLLVNGSPKRGKSASGLLLEGLRERLAPGSEAVLFESATPDAGALLAAAAGCGAVVFAFPLYVDDLPSHLLRLLDESCGGWAAAAPGARVYALVNNGYYEPGQCGPAVQVLRNFAACAGLGWGQGLCISGGGMLLFAGIGPGPMQKAGAALDSLAATIGSANTAEDLLVRPGIPARLYRAAGHKGWRSGAKKNGLRVQDLYRRPAPPQTD